MSTITVTGLATKVADLLKTPTTDLLSRTTAANQQLSNISSLINKVGEYIKNGSYTGLLDQGDSSLKFNGQYVEALDIQDAVLIGKFLKFERASFSTELFNKLYFTVSGLINLNKITGVITGVVDQLDVIYYPNGDISTQVALSLSGRMMISKQSITSGTINQISFKQNELTTQLSGWINLKNLPASKISAISIFDESNNGITFSIPMKYADLQDLINSKVSIKDYFVESPFAAKLFAGNDVFKITEGDSQPNNADGQQEMVWNAFAGNDIMVGGESKDIFYGGTGNDRLYGYDSNDSLYGEQGNDILAGGDGNDTLDGGEGNDQFDGGQGDDLMKGSLGNDRYLDLFGNNQITDTVGNSFITTGDGNDSINLGNGSGMIRAGGGKNSIFAKNGDYQIYAGSGDDSITVGSGSITINAGDGNNFIMASGGKVRIFCGDGNNGIYAFSGDVLINVGKGKNTIQSYSGNDKISTGDGNDTINTGDADDIIVSRGGDDVLTGGKGSDKISGGVGADLFNLRDLQDDGSIAGYDTITDFDADEGDKLSLNKSAFKKFDGLTAVDESNLVSANNAVVLDADDYLIFDEKTKILYYDADGNGTAPPVQIAILVGVAHLHPEDFSLVS